MTGFNKRVYEMLVRLTVFSKSYPHLFEGNPLAAQAMKDVEIAVERLATHDAWVEGGDAQKRVLTSDRLTARAELRQMLEALSRTARGLGRNEFSMPRGRNDATLVAVGDMWSTNLAALKQQFIDSGLPKDFIERLTAATDRVRRTIAGQTQTIHSRYRTVLSIEETRNAAMSAIRRLDPIILNLLRDDPPVLAVWQRARRIERRNSSKPVNAQQPVAPAS
jgi:hypothetical protein